jgi:hypothetical protein
MMMLALLIALAAVMAAAFFGLSVLVISVVGWLWPSKGVKKRYRASSKIKFRNQL